MIIELHFAPRTCSRVPLVALEKIGCRFDAHLVRFRAGDHKDELYLALNPKAKVPLLVVDGQPLTETVAILMLLVGMFPQAGLLPPGEAMADALVLSDLAWCASTLHPLTTRLNLPQHFSRLPEAAAGIRALADEELVTAFAIIEHRLGDRDWLWGDWSIVDAYLQWIWFRAANGGFDVASYPRFASLAARAEREPSCQRALTREEDSHRLMVDQGIIPPGPPNVRINEISHASGK